MGTSSKRLATVGDLVVAVTDAALEIVKDEKKAYQIAGLVVNEMLDIPFLKRIGRNSIRARVYRIISVNREQEEQSKHQNGRFRRISSYPYGLKIIGSQ